MENSIIKLYHGSKDGIKGNIKPISREFCDFGKGFYMGTQKAQPLSLICNYENAIMYELTVNSENLFIKDIPLNIEWALFVAFNRGRLTKDISPVLYKKYESYKNGVDIFKGYIANDRMFVVLDRFFDGEITDVALVKSLSALKLGIQYVAITQKACDSIKIITQKKLSAQEKKSLIAQSQENRERGVSLANDICRKFRREGKYFDEIVAE